MNVRAILSTALVVGGLPAVAASQAPLGAPWDSVGRILQTSGSATGGYYRYGWPRRDVTLRIGDVTVAPALALGAWAGFSGDVASATVMGDLVLTSGEVKPVLAELARQRIAVTAIHNHLVGEDPKITYVHFHAEGNPVVLAGRLDRVLALTGAPRPVTAAAPQPVTIDTALVFNTLGLHGRAQGAVAQVRRAVRPGGFVLVATFADDGPTRCSGLEVARYSPEALHAEFGAPFQLMASEREEHVTPAGIRQAFIYCLCRVD